MARAAAMMEDAETLQSYLDSIGKVPLLTKEEEVELALAIEHCHEAEQELQADGDLSPERRRELQMTVRRGTRARERFIQANLRLVVSIAKRFRGQGLPFLDLIQEGNLGLMTAVERFDWRRGFKFSTYATWWIRQAIQRGIANRARSIRLPVHVEEELLKVQRKALDVSQRLGREPTADELASQLAMEPARVEELLEFGRATRPSSLHALVGEEGETELGDLIEDLSAESPYDALEESMVRDDIAEAMQDALEPRERTVISLRFGFHDGRPRSLQQIGNELGISRERVRQIEREALSKLRAERRLTA